ncbi:hypothetical protein BJX70DRAFT_303478 [Aspergillus crustosus]
MQRSICSGPSIGENPENQRLMLTINGLRHRFRLRPGNRSSALGDGIISRSIQFQGLTSLLFSSASCLFTTTIAHPSLSCPSFSSISPSFYLSCCPSFVSPSQSLLPFRSYLPTPCSPFATLPGCIPLSSLRSWIPVLINNCCLMALGLSVNY